MKAEVKRMLAAVAAEYGGTAQVFPGKGRHCKWIVVALPGAMREIRLPLAQSLGRRHNHQVDNAVAQLRREIRRVAKCAQG